MQQSPDCAFLVVQQTLRLLDSCRTNNGEVRDILTRTQSAISVVTKTLLDKVRPTARVFFVWQETLSLVGMSTHSLFLSRLVSFSCFAL